MDNKAIYKKTLGFSLLKLIWDVISLLLVGAAATGGFFLAEKFMNAGIIGLFIGLIIGIIAAALISRFVAYRIRRDRSQ